MELARDPSEQCREHTYTSSDVVFIIVSGAVFKDRLTQLVFPTKLYFTTDYLINFLSTHNSTKKLPRIYQVEK